MKTSPAIHTRPAYRRSAIGTLFRLGLIFALVILVGLVAYRLISGRSLGLRSFVANQVRGAPNALRAIQGRKQVQAYSRGDFTNVIFLHHSVGHNLIEQGNLRQAFSAQGFSFWDQDYNDLGLTGPTGQKASFLYTIPDDNTDPDGLYRVFRQNEFGLPVNALSGLLQHEVILFKSCYTGSEIFSDEELGEYKQWYLEMREVMDRHPEKLFILLTPPPLNPAATNPEMAARARTFATWLSSEEYLAGHQNITTFNLFDRLAEPDTAASEANTLRQEYRTGEDSHPNLEANQATAPLLVDFVTQAVETYRQQRAGRP